MFSWSPQHNFGRGRVRVQTTQRATIAPERFHSYRAWAVCDVTRILGNIESGDPAAAEQLLPLVCEELRKLAVTKMAQEKPGQTLQATALVHEAYIRLVDQAVPQRWESRRHFLAAAAEANGRLTGMPTDGYADLSPLRLASAMRSRSVVC